MPLAINKKPLDFSVKEFSGAFSDLGLLIPFSISLVVISGVDPVGLLVGIGLSNIIIGLIYSYPLALQPMKAIGSTAISEKFSANQIMGAGFSCGIFWTLVSLFIDIDKYAKKIPRSVSLGISLGLGLILSLTALNLIGINTTTGLISLEVLIISLGFLLLMTVLLRNRKIPTVLIFLFLGVFIAFFSGTINYSSFYFEFTLPTFMPFSIFDVIFGFFAVGISQIVMTVASAVIASKEVIDEYWPNSGIKHKHLTTNMGIMNTLLPWIGTIPLCHGAGGIVAKKVFGSNSGGSVIIEGIVELILGLFFGSSMLLIFQGFPLYILGVMLLYTCYSLGKISINVEKRIIPQTSMLLTGFLSFILRFPLILFGFIPSLSIPIAFLIGWVFYIVFDPIECRKKPRKEDNNTKSSTIC
ncbi:MAG: putative sulfate/molybdate transporter [Candidatus Ranarchaeia archaeon]